MRFWISSTLFAVAIVMSPLLKAADENFDVYVFTDFQYDDNVFRVADSAEALAQNGTTTQDDVELTYGVGANVKIPVSRQQFNVDAELRRSNFDRFSQLDNNNGEIKGEWQWAYASRASGTLGYKYEQSLIDFFEFQNAVRDTEKEQDLYATARIPVHPRWTLVTGGSLQSIDFDERPELDRDAVAFFGELLFETRAKTFVGVRVREHDTDFDQNIGQDNDFSETEYGVVVRYSSTGKSRFSASLERTDRDSDDVSSGDFSGTTGKLEYRYALSGKTTIDFELSRDTSLVDEVASLVVTDGIMIQPRWSISPRLNFIGRVEYEERDFGGDGAQGGSGRSDDLFTLSARLSYKINRALSLNFGVGYRNRDSNVQAVEFDQSELSAGIRFKI